MPKLEVESTAASALAAPRGWKSPFARVEPWSQLAALRFVLAAIVAVNHLGEYVPLGALDLVRRMGAFEAILGFLLVSGYSIGASYRRAPQGFAWRRVRRIYPVYLVSLVLTGVVTHSVLQQTMPGPLELLANVLLLNQLVTQSSFVGPAWSLALEFWLYLLTPWLVAVGSRGQRMLAIVSFVAFLVYTALRSLLHWPYHAGVGFGANLLLLSFIWIGGLKLALADDRRQESMRDVRLIFAIHIVCAAVIQGVWRIKHQAAELFLSQDLPVLALQGLVLLLVQGVFAHGVLAARPHLRPWRSLQWLGDVSYPLFLLHIPVFMLLAQTPSRSPTMYLAVALLLAALVLWVLNRLQRVMGWRKALSA